MQIARALDPAVQAPAGAASTRGTLLTDDPFDVSGGSDLCWPDYVVLKR